MYSEQEKAQPHGLAVSLEWHDMWRSGMYCVDETSSEP